MLGKVLVEVGTEGVEAEEVVLDSGAAAVVHGASLGIWVFLSWLLSSSPSPPWPLLQLLQLLLLLLLLPAAKKSVLRAKLKYSAGLNESGFG
jgi:hypothetical protein